jgi:phosphoglycolate phosphatase
MMGGDSPAGARRVAPRAASLSRCLLLDLDGTLVDTAPDMTGALNALRRENGLPEIAPAIVRPHVSHGARALIRLGFGLLEDDPRFEPLRTRFLDIYAGCLARESRLFPGMDEVLAEVEGRGLCWGVVTNKPERFTHPLLAAIGLDARAACVVCGDTTTRPKPHPEPLLHAARTLDTPAASCLYVGDALRDIEAGRRAGMRTLVAAFGYLASSDRPEDWMADALIDHPAQILDWLEPTALARP